LGITRTLMPFEADYVQIPNAWLRDEKLSRRARGLLAELMTHRAGWHITIASLQSKGPEGRDAIRSAIAELIARNYLTVRQQQGTGGRFGEAEYELCDPASTGVGFSDSGSADSGSADVGESAMKNNILEKTIEIEDHPSEVLSPSAREIESEFDVAWQSWPKKDKRKESLRSFIKAARSRPVSDLVADITRFGQAYAASTERQFVPALCVWLNGERWTDELPVVGVPTDTEWASFVSGKPTPSQRAARTLEAGRMVGGRLLTSLDPRPDCFEHRWMADGTCNFCTARQLEVGAA
jgi:hypothetical protein